jgi:hypothetical protein
MRIRLMKNLSYLCLSSHHEGRGKRQCKNKDKLCLCDCHIGYTLLGGNW